MSYEAVIGLEVHVQINTKTKLFCSCPNKFGEQVNTLVCPICMGHPGVMPVVNYEAIRKAIIAGMMCKCEISRFSKFDRKSYFYPDMPKNYQISQYDLPFCKNGRIHIYGKGFSGKELPQKFIGITRIHLEEDVAKSNHFTTCSGIDFNRAGVPLLEIVSEPQMSGADEAYAYLVSLKEIMQYGNISNCDMEKGQMRCDVNISMKPKGQEKLGTKVELKNLNSFRAIHRAIDFEISRQSAVLTKGESILQETRGWNDDSGQSYLMRSKESAHDYRYFPEPDLLPIVFTDDDLRSLSETIPELPEEKRNRFVRNYEITDYDASILTSDKFIADYFEEATKFTKAYKLLANWIITELLRVLSDANIKINETKISPKNLAELIELINDNTVTGKTAKDVFNEMFESGKTPKNIVEDKGLTQLTNLDQIDGFVTDAIKNNLSQVEQYKAGKTTVLQYFVGQVMKLSKGKANPQLVIKLLKEKLNKQD